MEVVAGHKVMGCMEMVAVCNHLHGGGCGAQLHKVMGCMQVVAVHKVMGFNSMGWMDGWVDGWMDDTDTYAALAAHCCLSSSGDESAGLDANPPRLHSGAWQSKEVTKCVWQAHCNN